MDKIIEMLFMVKELRERVEKVIEFKQKSQNDSAESAAFFARQDIKFKDYYECLSITKKLENTLEDAILDYQPREGKASFGLFSNESSN